MVTGRVHGLWLAPTLCCTSGKEFRFPLLEAAPQKIHWFFFPRIICQNLCRNMPKNLTILQHEQMAYRGWDKVLWTSARRSGREVRTSRNVRVQVSGFSVFLLAGRAQVWGLGLVSLPLIIVSNAIETSEGWHFLRSTWRFP